MLQSYDNDKRYHNAHIIGGFCFQRLDGEKILLYHRINSTYAGTTPDQSAFHPH